MIQIHTFALFVVHHECEVSNGWSRWPIEAINDVGIRVGVFDVPLGCEVSDRPIDCVFIEQPAHGEILTSKGE